MIVADTTPQPERQFTIKLSEEELNVLHSLLAEVSPIMLEPVCESGQFVHYMYRAMTRALGSTGRHAHQFNVSVKK